MSTIVDLKIGGMFLAPKGIFLASKDINVDRFRRHRTSSAYYCHRRTTDRSARFMA
jgi:hypothetical protein